MKEIMSDSRPGSPLRSCWRMYSVTDDTTDDETLNRSSLVRLIGRTASFAKKYKYESSEVVSSSRAPSVHDSQPRRIDRLGWAWPGLGGRGRVNYFAVFFFLVNRKDAAVYISQTTLVLNKDDGNGRRDLINRSSLVRPAVSKYSQLY
jgi:hypothetical protein